ncbi:uncharacterized protein LOC132748062 [Ruditapes philippinarum]|uniref:uncharacterized protein LOC132748062 n=1 Tax=Ruditapes philippinarum TaxID=129788 RepID=UPI00295BA025|nr:uncharacterized protein LOC132748062 [Ruditapes philippinarum]
MSSSIDLGSDRRGDHFELSLTGSKQINRSSKNMCAICLDKYRNPKYLQCLHAFCEQPCLQSLLDRSENNIFKCPLCRQSYNVLTFECVSSESTANEAVPLLVERTEQSTAETNTCERFYTLSVLVVVFHFCIISVARIVLGLYSHECKKLLYAYQIAKGLIDIFIALSYCKNQTGVCTTILLGVSIIGLILGTMVAWESTEDNRQCHFLIVFSRYYVVADGILILFILICGRRLLTKILDLIRC